MKKALALAILSTISLAAHAEEHKQWNAGPYAFSDELGGFTITSVTGTGMRDDPVVITQEFTSSSPVTLTITAIKPGQSYDDPRLFATGNLRIRLETLNNSGQAWTEFEFELQEQKGQASIFSDGLSFDQRRQEGQNIDSDSFAAFSRNFEPYDRLRFTDGRIDPLKSGSFEFMITDFTPRRVFYLVQDPRIPLS